MPKYWVKQIFKHGRFPEVGQKQKTENNTPGTAGGPGGLRAPCVLVCAMRSLAIVITIVQSLSLSVFCF